jgi:hypothetical protein
MRRALVLLTAVGLLASGCADGTEGTPTSAKQGRTTKTTTTSKAPFDGELVDDGEVVRVDKLDGIHLDSPDDGRLRNFGVGVDVVDFGTGDVVDAGGGQSYGAQEDSTLLAFRLRVTPYTAEVSQKVKATVSVDGKQRSLPDFEYSMGTVSEDQTLQYIVGMPTDRREVELELKFADFAQQFDLLEGERTGEQPDILYRSADEPSVYVENLTPAKITVADPDGKPGAYIVNVTRAELTYFAPDLGDVPGDTGNAWLVVTYEPTGEGSLQYSPDAASCTVPFAAYKLNDGTKDYPVVDKHSTSEQFASEQKLVFEVPADLADAELTLTTQGFPCRNGGTDYAYTASGTAKITMNLPED